MAAQRVDGRVGSRTATPRPPTKNRTWRECAGAASGYAPRPTGPGEAWTAIEAPDYFQPEVGLVLTHLLIVRDVVRSRHSYQRVLGAQVVRERHWTILRFHNSNIVIHSEDGPTDDKADVPAQASPATG